MGTIEILIRTALVSSVAVGMAQGGRASAQAADQTSPAEEGSDIVVTAQKRQQRLRDVPIAITAITAKALDHGPVRDITDLVQIAPAVNGSANSSAQPLIAIRGIVSNDFSIGADPALGIYVNEVYTGRSAGAVQELVDIERIEIAKGPQGTLFGRNTTAGAISIITPKPKIGITEGRIRGAYGLRNQIEASIVANNMPRTYGVEVGFKF